MITNNDAQSALLAWMKANTTITALSSKFPTEIREIEWSGEDFTYPNIRISCEITGGECLEDCFIVIACNSEEKSSKQSQTMAGTVASEMHNKTFTQGNYRFSAMRAKTLRATQIGGIWRADVQINAKVV